MVIFFNWLLDVGSLQFRRRSKRLGGFTVVKYPKYVGAVYGYRGGGGGTGGARLRATGKGYGHIVKPLKSLENLITCDWIGDRLNRINSIKSWA